MKKIVLTGGGTAGHVTPNLALIPKLKELGYEISYIGSFEGIERKLIEEQGIDYYPIHTGKLRRYFDLKNFSDPFRVLKGGAEARNILKQLKPDIVFSKGGFVSVPVVSAARKLKIPVIIHESDITPGLANKLSIPSATKVCCNFPETLNNLPANKAVLTGSPIRKELLSGSAEAGLKMCGFNKEKPVILVIGGSTGAAAINNTIRGVLPELLKQYQVCHICGKGKTDAAYDGFEGYIQLEYVGKELPDIFAMADVAISRAGANSICEFLALQLPNILIPLPLAVSRGDQILNAASFESQGYSYVLEEENLSIINLLEAIDYVLSHRDKYVESMANSQQLDSINTVIGLIEEYRKK